MSDKRGGVRPLDGLVAVVTGAAQGLGLAMGERLASDGATVILADLQLDKAETEAKRLRQNNLLVQATMLDVADSAGVATFFGKVVDEYGRLDILVNNAGVGQRVTPVVELSDEEWQRVLSVTLNGAFYCCRAAGAIMERQESGSIVNISSINGQNPAALVAAYNVAKAGVIMLTKIMALELAGNNIRANAICPGQVMTDLEKWRFGLEADFFNTSIEEREAEMCKTIPLNRIGQPHEVGDLVSFLASDASSYITGQALNITGGQLMEL
jgi:NAD(P)-dependent dehydrogenase (short-subunit alcohol dehydrogenase family)